MKKQLLYIWLQQALGISSSLSREVLSRYDSIEAVHGSENYDFLGEKRGKYIMRLENKDTSSAYEVLKRCKALGVTVTGYYDEFYPDCLRKIDNPPVVLYSIGNLRKLDKIPCVGIVGTRKMTDYGREITERFAYTLAKSGVCIVSGLAKGIDTAAHRGAVMADGYTVAVLGNPIGDIYPKENVKAFETLYKRGLVISEMYPGAPRTKADFPNRNRIISGISDAVIVTEAGEGSGSLITARCAVKQGKKLFAVPGDIGAANAGTNTLIKTGVAIATDPRDILAPLLLEYPEATKPYEPSATEKLRSYGNAMPERHKAEGKEVEKATVKEKTVKQETKTSREEKKEQPRDVAEIDLSSALSQRILSALSGGKLLSADEICTAVKADISEVMIELTMLEISGEIGLSAGGRFSKL